MRALDYAVPSSLWQHFEFRSTLVTALVVSLLTTLISYQLTAVLTDLILGCKPSRTSRVYTLHALLLSRRSSPLAILNALLRRDELTRLYFRRYISSKVKNLARDKTINRDEAGVKTKATCFLALLLVTPPVLNILVVGLTVESEEVVSFREAEFGGLSVGVVRHGGECKREPMTEECDLFLVERLAYDEVTAQVVLCKQMTVIGANPERDKKAGIGLLVVDEVTFLVQLSLGTRYWNRQYTGFIRTRNGENLLLRAEADRKAGGAMIQRGLKKILEVCQSNLSLEDTVEYYEGISVSKWENFVVGRKEVPCKIDVETEEKGLSAIYAEVGQFVSIIRTKEMMVKTSENERNEKAFDAGDNEFLRRRTRIAGMGMLAIVAGIVTAARVVAGLVLNNDVNDGIERIVKERIGLDYCDSPLSERERNTFILFNNQLRVVNREVVGDRRV